MNTKVRLILIGSLLCIDLFAGGYGGELRIFPTPQPVERSIHFLTDYADPNTGQIYYINLMGQKVVHTSPVPLFSPPTASQLNDEKNVQARTVMWLKSQTAAGSPSAQYELGIRYIKGDGVETNSVLGLNMVGMAATNGCVEAQEFLKSKGKQ